MQEDMKIILDAIVSMESRIDKKLEAVEERLNNRIDSVETGLKLYMENTISAKIDALFDGYQSALEKQVALKEANRLLAQRIDDMEQRLIKLEQRAM